jgi:hypothetical protein
MSNDPVDTRSWWQKHHIWQYIFGGATALAGLSSLVPMIAAASPHAGAVVALASGIGMAIVTAHQQAVQTAPADPTQSAPAAPPAPQAPQQ